MFTSYPQCRLASKPQEEDSGGFGEWLASVQTDKLTAAAAAAAAHSLAMRHFRCRPIPISTVQ